eukprot:contig_44584_g9915
MDPEVAYIVTQAAHALPTASDPVSLAILRTLGLCVIHAAGVTVAALERAGRSDAVY